MTAPAARGPPPRDPRWGRERPLPLPYAWSGGELTVDGVPLAMLAERFGTPLYVTSASRIRANARRAMAAFGARWKEFQLLYAVKANNNPSVVRLLAEEGCGADCSSPAEILLARRAGIPPERTLFTSVLPREEDLRRALASRCAVNLDDPQVLPTLLALGRPRALAFRLNPGPTEAGPEGLRFSGDSKFGTSLPRALAGYREAHRAGIRDLGIHTMPGSNVLRPEHFGSVARFLARAARALRRAVGSPPAFVDLGGGLGVPYRPHEEELDLDRVASLVARRLREGDIPSTTPLWAEPGRYLVADSTVLLTRVTHRKGGRVPFLGVDAGMHTLLRPALYGAYHGVYAVQGGDRALAVRPVHLAGPVCENTDVLARRRRLPQLAAGDLLALGNAGAYGFAMSSEYNTRPRPAEVMVSDGRVFLIRRRQKVEELWARTGRWEIDLRSPGPSRASRFLVRPAAEVSV